MDDIRVSIIIPVHNAKEYLTECLDSVFGQTEQMIEVICVDDGSSDGSASILDDRAQKEPRMTVIHQACSGAGTARNAGLKLARGCYLSFLDADDFFESNMLKDAADKLDETNADIVVYGAWIYDAARDSNRQAPWTLRREFLPSTETFNRHDMPRHIFNAFGNYTWNKLFRRSFITDHHLAFQEISRTNDLLFVCSALALASTITILEKPYVHYRVSSTSLQATNDRDPLSFFSAFCSLQDYLKTKGIYDELEVSFLNHALDGVIANMDSLKTLEGAKTLKKAVVEQIEPRLSLLSRPASLFENAEQFQQYRDLFELDLTGYLFKKNKSLRVSREDAYWRIDWLEWHAWKLSLESSELHEQIKDERQKNIEELEHENELRLELQKELQDARDRIGMIEASKSYRIGQALTAIVKAIKRVLHYFM